MDPVVIPVTAAAVLTALQPYWPAIAAGVAEKFGEELPAALGKLWQAVRQRFDAEDAAKPALDQLLTDPKNEKMQAVVEWQLEQLLTKDKAFAENLRRLLPEVQAQAGNHASVHGSGTVVKGSGNKVVGAGGVLIEGGVQGDFTHQPPGKKQE